MGSVAQEDKVNHPEHYNAHKMECIEEMKVLFGETAVYHFVFATLGSIERELD